MTLGGEGMQVVPHLGVELATSLPCVGVHHIGGAEHRWESSHSARFERKAETRESYIHAYIPFYMPDIWLSGFPW